MMLNVSEAKTNLSKLIDMVYHGETVVIAKNNLPVVDMIPHKSAQKRKLGLLKGKGMVPESFDDECEAINDMFYGNES